MAHKCPLPVWVVWFRDRIHTNKEQQLAVFPRRKDADTWIKKNAVFYADCAVRRLVITKNRQGGEVQKRQIAGGGLLWAKKLAIRCNLLCRGKDVETVKAIREAYAAGYSDAEQILGTSGDGLLHDRPPTTGKIIPGKSRRITKKRIGP